MPIETWFPLAIYYEELVDAPQYQKLLLETVLQLEKQSEQKILERDGNPEMAWTGDLHGVEQIHSDPRFAWIVEQVEAHTLIYLQEIGVDVTKLQLFIQRAWPIVSRPGQSVGDHCHNTAHISAVFYISVPDSEEDAGSLVFFDDVRVNEVSPGLGSENTNIVDQDNFLNQLQVVYEPVAGRLLLFPAKQRHGVTMNETDDVRVSLSFDIVITASDRIKGVYEFLAPAPQQWRAFSQ